MQANRSQLIRVAGPYRSGTNDDPALIEANVALIEANVKAPYTHRGFAGRGRTLLI